MSVRGFLAQSRDLTAEREFLVSDPCLQRLSRGVFHSCGAPKLTDPAGCCSLLHAPTGCSAAWSGTFSIYSHRYRNRLADGHQCAASWPCLFDSTDRNTPCFTPVCAGLFSHEGDLTPDCYRHVQEFCSGDEAPRPQCDSFFNLTVPGVCGPSGAEWRHCAAAATVLNAGAPIPERAAAKRLGIKRTIATRFTAEEYGSYLLDGCGMGRHRPQCPAATPPLYDPVGNSTHPFFVRAGAFSVIPSVVPYVSPEGQNVAIIAMTCAVLLFMHVVDFVCFRTRRQFIDL